MGDSDSRNEATLPPAIPQGLRATPSRLSLIVAGEGVFATHSLPESGTVVIGRGDDCDIVIDHNSISRRHAALQIGSQLAIQDLGSSNGTRVREQILSPNVPAVFAPNELVELASITVIVQARSSPLQPRRVRSHEYFEARLEEECARAIAKGSRFSVLHLHLPAAVELAAIEGALVAELRTTDVIAAYTPHELEILIEDPDVEPKRIADGISGKLAEHGIRVGVGIASWPEDGRSADALTSTASARARGEASAAEASESVLGHRGAMQDLRYLVERVAAGNISVLILGETGVGKEVLAETVHRMSPRREKPFLKLNCAALTETLLESELFGHERGAFTGAIQAKPGLLETADGGTIFLDEIGELPLPTQVKLLRVLEERKVMRVGALKARSIDVRFVAATNRDLEAEATRGSFRQDLFFRLNGISLVIPPLRERVDEIEELAEVFIKQAAGADKPPPLSPEALELLERYAWPGNVRELRNMMERAVLLCTNGVIRPENLPVEKMQAHVAVRASRRPSRPSIQPMVVPPEHSRMGRQTIQMPSVATNPTGELIVDADDFKRESRAVEKQQILDALTKCGGNQTLAAKMLGISRRTLLNRLDELAVPRPRKKTLG